jgi:DnaJ family protein C protein 25
MYKMAVILLALLSLICTTTFAQEDEERPLDIYCGDMTCYEVLGLVREEATRRDIQRSYRKLAGKWHPDMFRTTEEKTTAEEKFMQIATAYETLREDESRADYDYMLDNPEEMWRNYYRYYRRRVGPKVDVRLVLAFTISMISACQYYFSWSNYNEAIKYFASIPKYRIQANEIAKADGLVKKDKKSDRGKSKEEIKEEEENVIRKIIMDKMDIRGAFAKPDWKDVLWVQLVILPYTIFIYMKWYGSWVWRFWVKREEYTREEHLYLIRKQMGVSTGKFNMIEEDEIEEMLEQELWIPENYKVYKEDKDLEQRAKMADSGRMKQYRRYMKNHGGDRMTFDDS